MLNVFRHFNGGNSDVHLCSPTRLFQSNLICFFGKATVKRWQVDYVNAEPERMLTDEWCLSSTEFGGCLKFRKHKKDERGEEERIFERGNNVSPQWILSLCGTSERMMSKIKAWQWEKVKHKGQTDLRKKWFHEQEEEYGISREEGISEETKVSFPCLSPKAKSKPSIPSGKRWRRKSRLSREPSRIWIHPAKVELSFPFNWWLLNEAWALLLQTPNR